MANKIRILIIEEDAVFDNYLFYLLGTRANFEVMALPESIRAVEETLKELSADVILLAAAYPWPGAGTLLAHIKQQLPQARVIVIANEPGQEPDCNYIELGAIANITRNCPLSRLFEIIEAVSLDWPYAQP